METSELDRRLVLGIGDLDAATNRLWKIEEKVAEAIDELKVDWCEANGWRADSEEWGKDDECCVAPLEWAPTDDDWNYWFALDFEHGKPSYNEVGADSFWLTKLCGEGLGGMGFRLDQQAHKAVIWKGFLRSQSGALSGTKFIIDDKPSVYLPVRIDKSELAEAVAEDNFVNCLKPIRDALDHIRDHSSRLIGMLSKIDSSVGEKGKR